MSRVTYANTPSTLDQETLRATHEVRIVSPDEEGTGVNALPGGVYGFTYSPGLPNAPLFAERRFRSYETHKLANGDVHIIGFADVETAAVLVGSDPGDDPTQDLESPHHRGLTPKREQTIQVQPEPDEKANVLVKIPYARIRQHRQYAAPNQHGFTVTIVGN